MGSLRKPLRIFAWVLEPETAATMTTTLSQTRQSAPLPDYALEMKHFHCAFAAELKGVIESLPLTPDMHVVDVGCGDGFYMELFASHLNERGAVTGIDSNRAYLEIARKRLSAHKWLCDISFINGCWDQSPLAASNADLVWSAQSLFSLPDPALALREMAEAVHPGGFVAVLENDTLHQLLLPWPAELELAVRTAELAYLSEEQPSRDKYYVGRRLPALFAEAGLDLLSVTMQSSTRQPPFGEHLTAFIQAYLNRLTQRVAGRLDRKSLRELTRLTSPDSQLHLLRQPNTTIGWLNSIAWGRRPANQ